MRVMRWQAEQTAGRTRGAVWDEKGAVWDEKGATPGTRRSTSPRAEVLERDESFVHPWPASRDSIGFFCF